MAEGVSTDGLTGQTTRLAHLHAHEQAKSTRAMSATDEDHDRRCGWKRVRRISTAGAIAHGKAHKKTPAAANGYRCFLKCRNRDEGRSVLGRPGSDLLFQVLRLSTIGAGEFNGRVRNGIGFRLSAKTTRPAKDGFEKQSLVAFKIGVTDRSLTKSIGGAPRRHTSDGH